MDLHRARIPNGIYPQPGRACEFCKRFDPDFDVRSPSDQLVIATANDVASSHLTEDGHVKHRLWELRKTLNLPIRFSTEAASREYQ